MVRICMGQRLGFSAQRGARQTSCLVELVVSLSLILLLPQQLLQGPPRLPEWTKILWHSYLCLTNARQWKQASRYSLKTVTNHIEESVPNM